MRNRYVRFEQFLHHTDKPDAIKFSSDTKFQTARTVFPAINLSSREQVKCSVLYGRPTSTVNSLKLSLRVRHHIKAMVKVLSIANRAVVWFNKLRASLFHGLPICAVNGVASQMFGQHFSRGESDLHYIVKVQRWYVCNQPFTSVYLGVTGFRQLMAHLETCLYLLNIMRSTHFYMSSSIEITFVWPRDDNCVDIKPGSSAMRTSNCTRLLL